MANFVGITASAALITLATTGNPVPLRDERGGTIINSDRIPAAQVLVEGEHLAPKALLLNDGTIVAMVAPTITKDNFVEFRNGRVKRIDAGVTEGQNRTFQVTDIESVKDGGASIFEQIGHWFQNLFSGE